MHARRCLISPFTSCQAHEGASSAGCCPHAVRQAHFGDHLAMQRLLLGAGSLAAAPFRGPVMHAAALCWCSPAEHMRGTPSRLSPMLAACAATTLAAWTCSVRETASEGGPSLGARPSVDTACSPAAECCLSICSTGPQVSVPCLQLSLVIEAADLEYFRPGHWQSQRCAD